MDDSYNVYPDKVRSITTAIIFGAFVLMFFAVVFAHTWLIIKLFSIFFASFFLYLVVKTTKYAFKNTPDYIIDCDGISDKTRVPEVTLEWSDILKVEMTPNNSVMQIGILAQSALESDEKRAAALKDNLKNNGNMAFYSIMIDGFKYRSKPFMKIFKEIQVKGGKHNPNIMITEYIDPETKRKLADKRDSDRRKARRIKKAAIKAKKQQGVG